MARYLFADPAPGPLGNVDGEDRVAPVRLFIEVVLSGRTHQLAPVQQIQGFLLGLHLGRSLISPLMWPLRGEKGGQSTHWSCLIRG